MTKNENENENLIAVNTVRDNMKSRVDWFLSWTPEVQLASRTSAQVQRVPFYFFLSAETALIPWLKYRWHVYWFFASNVEMGWFTDGGTGPGVELILLGRRSFMYTLKVVNRIMWKKVWVVFTLDSVLSFDYYNMHCHHYYIYLSISLLLTASYT